MSSDTLAAVVALTHEAKKVHVENTLPIFVPVALGQMYRVLQGHKVHLRLTSCHCTYRCVSAKLVISHAGAKVADTGMRRSSYMSPSSRRPARILEGSSCCSARCPSFLALCQSEIFQAFDPRCLAAVLAATCMITDPHSSAHACLLLGNVWGCLDVNAALAICYRTCWSYCKTRKMQQLCN